MRRLLAACAALALAARAYGRKIPYDKATQKIQHSCWVPDYCDPEAFRYKLCKLRLRGRKAVLDEHACPEGEYCEEVECEGNKCFLPVDCWCHTEADGHYKGGLVAAEHAHGRMFCSEEGCTKHRSTQWGICRPDPTEAELAADAALAHDDDEPAPRPTGFHFYSKDALLYNSKLHIDEGHAYARERVPLPQKDEL